MELAADQLLIYSRCVDAMLILSLPPGGSHVQLHDHLLHIYSAQNKERYRSMSGLVPLQRELVRRPGTHPRSITSPIALDS
jgi:hypothetical protein